MSAQGELALVQEELPAVNRIRVETVLSRYPIHRLSKSATGGTIDLYPDIEWRVSHNTDYGQPGPLAYKVDTLIINRRLDQAPRPLPEVLRIGSLREICRELGQSDHDTEIVKRALHQNASAYITAKLRQVRKGRERKIEVGYTRYSVVFSGETLPDGQAADAVYVVLNPQHRKLLNEVEVRPLDYDYLFNLAPAPQRLYELLSFPIFGALTNSRPRAKLRYSEFCMFAPVTRYLDYDGVKKQMHKIHKPHREAGYISKVEFQACVDEKGKQDWVMYYTPGPKALKEFRAFTHRSTVTVAAPTPRESPSDLPLSQTSVFNDPDPALLSELLQRGITSQKARNLLANLKPGQEVMDQVEYTDFVVAQAPTGKFHNPPGLYIRNIEQNITVPATFESSRSRSRRLAAQETKDAERAYWAGLELAYEEYKANIIDAFIATMSADDYQNAVCEQRKLLKRTYRNMTEEQLDALATASLRTVIKQSDKIRFSSFDEFRQMLLTREQTRSTRIGE